MPPPGIRPSLNAHPRSRRGALPGVWGALAAALLWAGPTGATPAASPRAGIGSVSGEGSARYRLISPKPVRIPSYEVAGYRQVATGAEGTWDIEVTVSAEPIPVREPFTFRPRSLPASLSSEMRSALGVALKPCQRIPEAVEAVLLFFRERIAYAQRPPFIEKPAEVVRQGQASCVGMTRLCAEVLTSQGVGAREVLGLRVPGGGGSARLEGGILHAWLEVECGSEGRFFYDPWRTCGWVPEGFVVLRVGSGLDLSEFAGLLGGTLETLARIDRVFYEPAPGVRNLLWRRPQRAEFTGTLITGKVLGPADGPLAGKATLKSGGVEVSMDLWEGNFFFRDLPAGVYAVRIDAPGVPADEGSVELAPMDKRRFLVYSREGRERRKDGAGRQP